MPELPEVQTIITSLKTTLLDKSTNKIRMFRGSLRYPFDERMEFLNTFGKVISVRRRAKYIIIDFENGMSMLVHLGMSGRFKFIPNEDKKIDLSSAFNGGDKDETILEKHDHLLLELSDKSYLIYNDPRRFGFVLLFNTAEESSEKHLAKLGIEPEAELTADYLFNKFKSKNSPIKPVLLDQSILVGLGNIYVCESLWRSGINPTKPTNSISIDMLDILCINIKNVLAEAIQAGGSTLNDYRDISGKEGYFQHSFDVYGRTDEPCKSSACGGAITKIVQAGRSTFYCPNCQK